MQNPPPKKNMSNIKQFIIRNNKKFQHYIKSTPLQKFIYKAIFKTNLVDQRWWKPRGHLHKHLAWDECQ